LKKKRGGSEKFNRRECGKTRNKQKKANVYEASILSFFAIKYSFKKDDVC
jgi:hypothetical protein